MCCRCVDRIGQTASTWCRVAGTKQYEHVLRPSVVNIDQWFHRYFQRRRGEGIAVSVGKKKDHLCFRRE